MFFEQYLKAPRFLRNFSNYFFKKFGDSTYILYTPPSPDNYPLVSRIFDYSVVLCFLYYSLNVRRVRVRLAFASAVPWPNSKAAVLHYWGERRTEDRAFSVQYTRDLRVTSIGVNWGGKKRGNRLPEKIWKINTLPFVFRMN